jgi:nucleoside 2-deoxyribosyltransferase
MDGTTPTAFFAYPSKPPSISETIKTAVNSLNRSGLTIFKTWEDCRVGGQIIIDEICTQISEADLFCADLTHLNANVMFELGYAIASNKRIWLILDNSLIDSNKHFEQVRILTTVGYANYCNSRDIETKFYSDRPYTDLDKTIFERSIKPNLVSGRPPQLLYLKSRHNTDANIRISKRVDDSKISVIIDDPRESSVQSLTW